MHSFEGPEGTLFHHNGDFSGDVVIEDRVGSPGPPMSVPFADLQALVAQELRQRRISYLESLSPSNLLGTAG